MGKRYKSVIDMVNDLIDDDEFKESLKKEIQDKLLAKKLYGMRCAASITQTKMAKLMGCKQSRISKLENAGLNSIKVGDLLAYTKALGLKLSIRFRKGETTKESPMFEIKTPVNEEESISPETAQSPLIIAVPFFYRWVVEPKSEQSIYISNKGQRKITKTN